LNRCGRKSNRDYKRQRIRKACFENQVAVLAPEARKTVAHGETAGLAVKTNQAPAGAAENWRHNVSFAPFRGSDGLGLVTHSFAVGYYRSLFHSCKWILKTRPGIFLKMVTGKSN
jgi:hypothetical protein